MNRDYEVERALKILLKFADPDGLRCECPRYCRSCESQSAARSIRAALQASPQEPKRPAMHRIRLTTEGWYNTEVMVEDIELLRAKAPDLFLEKRLDEIMGRHVAYVTAQKAKGEPQEVHTGEGKATGGEGAGR